jgi:putative ABC transport system permease protein
VAIFVNLIRRGASAVQNIGTVDLSVMDPASRTTDVVFPIPSKVPVRVRGVKGVEWAANHL